jgi:hypothetical protein
MSTETPAEAKAEEGNESVVAGLTKIISSIEDVLRYVAPGFVGMALVVAAFGGSRSDIESLVSDRWTVLVVGAVLTGVILNSCHVAILEDLFCGVIIKAFWCVRTLKNKPVEGVDLLSMEWERELRRTSKERLPRHFQKRHDGLGATLTFLYCSSYPGLAIGICLMRRQDTCFEPFLVIGGGFLLFAIVCDVTYTLRDLRATEKMAASPKASEERSGRQWCAFGLLTAAFVFAAVLVCVVERAGSASWWLFALDVVSFVFGSVLSSRPKPA